jgi:hypothetical protein
MVEQQNKSIMQAILIPTLTKEQAQIANKPFNDLSGFTGGGALSLRRAKKFWLKRLQEEGASPRVVEQVQQHWEQL